MRRPTLVFATLGVLVAAPAAAEPARIHAFLGGAQPAGAPQSSEFGPGGALFASAEAPIGRHFGVEGELGGLLLSNGDPRAGFAPKGTGVVVTGMGGARVRFLGDTPAGPWIAAHAGPAVTGDRLRFAFDAALGWDFRLGHGRIDVGPFAGYVHVVEPDGGLAPEDAHVFVLGIAFGLGVPEIPPPYVPPPAPPADTDRDGILDTEDACPREPGIRTHDPATNGCPRRDADGDGIVDDVDACPTVKGVATSDPKTNGCPPDRDHDGIVDDVDACPDLAGVASTDPKANGCPPPSDGARVVGDRIVLDDVILFDTDSARVRHVSWPVVKKLAVMLQKSPDIVEVYVEGHTDPTGPQQWNQQLSQDRAESVKKLLVSFGVADARIITHGYGASHLRTTGTSQEAFRADRRVEFIITRTNTAPGGIP